ncbi:hypothetical protein, partial [Xanthomonas sp. SHU 166]|uniref:hypothetical protein n=1 Tax=Xanthomonas sp. SHU 166 TaxID=1591170 RepID=UPI001E5C2AFC
MSAVDCGGRATTMVFEEAAGAVVRGVQVAVPACTQLRRITIAMPYVCAVSAIAFAIDVALAFDLLGSLPQRRMDRG